MRIFKVYLIVSSIYLSKVESKTRQSNGGFDSGSYASSPGKSRFSGGSFERVGFSGVSYESDSENSGFDRESYADGFRSGGFGRESYVGRSESQESYAGGSGNSGSFANGFGSQMGSFGGGGGVIKAAIRSKYTFETKPVPIQFEPQEPQIIEVEGGDLPIEIHFKSSSSRVTVKQSHDLLSHSEPEYEQHEEEPYHLVTEVRKPIIQEVREIIAPYRKVIQEIEPVIEEIHTIISQGDGPRSKNQFIGSGDSYDGDERAGNFGGGSHDDSGNGGNFGSGSYVSRGSLESHAERGGGGSHGSGGSLESHGEGGGGGNFGMGSYGNSESRGSNVGFNSGAIFSGQTQQKLY